MTLDEIYEIVKSETCIKSYTIEKEKSDNLTILHFIKRWYIWYEFWWAGRANRLESYLPWKCNYDVNKEEIMKDSNIHNSFNGTTNFNGAVHLERLQKNRLGLHWF